MLTELYFKSFTVSMDHSLKGRGKGIFYYGKRMLEAGEYALSCSFGDGQL